MILVVLYPQERYYYCPGKIVAYYVFNFIITPLCYNVRTNFLYQLIWCFFFENNNFINTSELFRKIFPIPLIVERPAFALKSSY